MNTGFLLMMASALCVITALLHSILGERRLIIPLLASDTPITKSPLARGVIRFAWHWTTILWFFVAAILAFYAYGIIEAPRLILAVGIAHVAMGLVDAILTRGRHVGWPLITLIGVLTLLALYTTR